MDILGKKAEDRSRHEMVHVVTACCTSPIWVVLQKLDIEPVELVGDPYIESITLLATPLVTMTLARSSAIASERVVMMAS